MKRFFAITITIVMSYSYGNNNQTKITDMSNVQSDSNYHNNSIFIIPQNDKSLICRIENNLVHETGSITKSIKSKSIIVNDEFICSIDSIISIYDIKGNLLKEINSDFELTSLNSKNKVAYFGGKSNQYERNPGEIFALIDFEKKDFELKTIKLPIDISYGKAIDDILIMKNKLLLVDNIVYPKYLLEYDISDSKNPKHIETKELENNGTYEHIVKGDLNESWLILLSSTIGMGGSSDHIVINGKTKGHIAVYREFNFNGDPKSEIQKSESLADICLINSMLYVLVNSTVYSLDLNVSTSKDDMKKLDSKWNSIKKIIHTPNNGIILIGQNDNFEKIN